MEEPVHCVPALHNVCLWSWQPKLFYSVDECVLIVQDLHQLFAELHAFYSAVKPAVDHIARLAINGLGIDVSTGYPDVDMVLLYNAQECCDVANSVTRSVGRWENVVGRQSAGNASMRRANVVRADHGMACEIEGASQE